MEVLEFGCGTGSTAISHAPYVKHIQAIDFSSEMIAIAQAKADSAQVQNVTFAPATIDDLKVPDESFDAVLGLNVLHLLNDREAVITKVYRMLKPGAVQSLSRGSQDAPSSVFGLDLSGSLGSHTRTS
jgi:ubiquinone/menaquinone biosynthesis C-methylase UbiE